MLLQVHAVLAGATQCEELLIDGNQSMALAQALAQVQSHYVGEIDPKTQAWVQLGIVAGAIYIPKAMQIRERKMQERADAASMSGMSGATPPRVFGAG